MLKFTGYIMFNYSYKSLIVGYYYVLHLQYMHYTFT